MKTNFCILLLFMCAHFSNAQRKTILINLNVQNNPKNKFNIVKITDPVNNMLDSAVVVDNKATLRIDIADYETDMWCMLKFNNGPIFNLIISEDCKIDIDFNSGFDFDNTNPYILNSPYTLELWKFYSTNNNFGKQRAQINNKSIGLELQNFNYIKKTALTTFSPSLAGYALVTLSLITKSFVEIIDLTEQVDSVSSALLQKHSNSLFLQERINNLNLTKYDSSQDQKILNKNFQKFILLDTSGIKKEVFVKKSKYTVIDFWASWCKPCRVFNKELLEIFYKYKKSDLSIISVSIDTNKSNWIKAINEDGITHWENFRTDKGWLSAIISSQNIMAIPTTIIVDNNGIVISQSIGENKLENILSKLINK